MAFKFKNNIGRVEVEAQRASMQARRLIGLRTSKAITKLILQRTVKRTGRLSRSSHVRQRTPNVWVTVGEGGAFYWKYLEYGTRYIRARRFVRDGLRTVRNIRLNGQIYHSQFSRIR